MAAAEVTLGHPLPSEVRDLYSIARAGKIGILNLTPIDQLAQGSMEQLESLEQDLEWQPGSDPNHWDGEIPQGSLVALSQESPHIIFYECDGPLAGRVVDFGFEGVDDTWGRLASPDRSPGVMV